MILLKQPNLLFLKSRKTAGTSFEIALSKFADENSVITPINSEDEKTRKQLGFRGPQNYLMKNLIFRTGERKFFNHISAKLVKQRLGVDVWENSFKISIVRNPYDRAVSRYFWSKKTFNYTPEEFENFYTDHRHLKENLEQYLIDDKDIIDFYISYESIQQDILRLEEKFTELSGLAKLFGGIKAKGNYRPHQNTSTSEIFSRCPKTKKIIAEICRFDI
jgi:hypothetical protein